MKVYFENTYGEMRVIAELDGGLSKEDAWKAVMKEIHKFCNDHKFKIYYTRSWVEEKNGVTMTGFDVGSHTEFFYVDRNILFL